MTNIDFNDDPPEQTGDGFVMKLKKVMLANNDTVVSNLTFII